MTKQYTSKERVEAIFRREQTDRIPVVLGLTVQLAPRAGYELNEARLDPEKAWKTALLTEELIPTDMLRVPANPYLPDVLQARQEGTLGSTRGRQYRMADKANLKTFSYRPPKESRAFAAHLDTAFFVDAFDGEIIAVFGVLAIGRIFSGERNRSTKENGVALNLGPG